MPDHQDDQPQPQKTAPKSPPRCPSCGKPRQHQYRPFCSARCRDVDLGKWFTGSYAIPVKDDDYDDQAPPGRST